MLTCKRPLLFALLLSFLVSACFSSEKPLLTEEDATTPLPASFVMIETDGSGTLKFDDKGQPKKNNFVLKGKIYSHGYDGAELSMTIADIDRASGTYLVQDMMAPTIPDKDAKALITYYLIKILDNVVVKYDPPAPGKSGLDAALKKAGVVYAEKGENFQFSDKAQLLAAAKVYAARMIDGKIVRYRLASSPLELAALDKDIDAARPKPMAQAPAAPPVSRPEPVLAQPQESGAQVVHPCDELAANPFDPNRMTTGIKMDAIVPARAVRECERAATQYPNTPRFRYQLGRAQEASRNISAAMASYQLAASMGDGMGWLNLGNIYAYGSGGVTVDLKTAEAYYRKAIAAGVNAQASLLQVAFMSDGYSNPRFFEAIYSGNLAGVDPKSVSVYLGEFMQMFKDAPDCQGIISTYAFSKLLQHEVFGTLGQMFGALTNADRSYRPGDFGAAAQSGWNAGMTATNNLFMQVSNAQGDARLLYDRHGCQSPVARQFFRNIDSLASRM